MEVLKEEVIQAEKLCVYLKASNNQMFGFNDQPRVYKCLHNLWFKEQGYDIKFYTIDFCQEKICIYSMPYGYDTYKVEVADWNKNIPMIREKLYDICREDIKIGLIKRDEEAKNKGYVSMAQHKLQEILSLDKI